MGAVFALGFLWLMVFSIGAILDFVAVFFIILRDILKRKSKKKHIILLIVELLFLIPGSACLMPTAGGAAVLMIGSSVNLHKQEKRTDYFAEHVDTDTVIQLGPDTIRGRATLARDSFEINGTEYVYYSGSSVEYRDSHRGEAIANLADEDDELTVYRYNIEPTDCDIVCAGWKVYIASEDADRILEYYSEGDFTYELSEHSGSSKTEEVDISDEVYLSVINGDPGYTELLVGGFNTEKSYYLEQISSNGFFKRKMHVMLDREGDIYVYIISNPLYSYDYPEGSYRGYFRVTYGKAADELRKYMDG